MMHEALADVESLPGGIAKAFMVPGWRMGWILVHDRNGLLTDVRTALLKLSQLILGANTLVQSVINSALHEVPDSYASDPLVLPQLCLTSRQFSAGTFVKRTRLWPITPKFSATD
jgi:aspartate/methionine/tyrosine aminotransferase